MILDRQLLAHRIQRSLNEETIRAITYRCATTWFCGMTYRKGIESSRSAANNVGASSSTHMIYSTLCKHTSTKEFYQMNPDFFRI